MIYSMTGFGRAEGRVLERDVVVEIRTVNNRYREVSVRVPKTYVAIEDKIKKIVGRKISRGRVDLFIQINESGIKQNRLFLDMALAKTYHELLTRMKEELTLAGNIDVSHIIRFQDVIGFEPEQLDLDAFLAGLETILGEALDRLVEMRLVEGEAIDADFRERLKRMAGWLDEIEAQRETILAAIQEKLLTRLKALTEDMDFDPVRLHQEAAILIDRSDITEELVRLRSHFEQFETLLSIGEPVGRKLEFLIQELNREINTIGSKTGDVNITGRVVDLKTETEKLREQVQNVE